MVSGAAQRFGASFRAERVEVADGPNLEARSREVRLAALGPGAATGHTADDQAETVLANLLRGAGVRGLSAMGSGPEHPLLALRRSETVTLCDRLGLTPVHDPSNDDPRFVRNRLRHELVPLCSQIAGRDVVPILARQAGVLGGDADLLEAVASLVDPHDAAALASAPDAVGRRSVRAWLTGDGPYPPPLDAVDRVLEVAAPATAGHPDPGGPYGPALGGTAVDDTGRAGHPDHRPGLHGRAGRSGTVGPVMADRAEVPGPPDRPEPSLLEEGPEVGPVIVSEADLHARITELGQQITADYAGRAPLLVGVLKGAFMFMSDLSRAIDLPVEVDFMAVSSYGSATRTSGVVRIVKDLDVDLVDRHVLVVEDIVDSGLTLNYLQRYLMARSPASLEVCALLVKDGQQRTEIDLRYVGFHIPPEFVVGYGLDVDERLRNLRAVHAHADGLP